MRVSLPDGKRKSLFGKTRAEALSKARAVLHDLEKGVLPTDGRTTVQTYLHQWLEDMRASLDYKSYHHYESQIRLHLVPRIGKVPLAKLTPFQLNQLYAAMLDDGYSHTSVRLVHRLIKQALIKAVKLDILARNVALLATPPKPIQRDMDFLAREEAKRLLDAARAWRRSGSSRCPRACA